MSAAPPARIAFVLVVVASLLLAGGTAPFASAAQPAAEHFGGDRMVQPRFRVPPAYPYALYKKGLSGTVLVEFIVTKTGDVVDPKVIRASDPSFGPPAVEAIRHWKFSPGLKNGQPVNSRVRQEIAFNIADANILRAVDFFAGAVPEPIDRVTPDYPVELNGSGITGYAIVEFVVGPTGDVVDASVLEATHPLFGEAAVNGIRQWHFRPPIKNGRPASAVLHEKIEFRQPGVAPATNAKPANATAR